MHAIVLGITVAFFISFANTNWINQNFENERAYKHFGISKMDANRVSKLVIDTTKKNEDDVILEKIYKIPEVKKKDHFIDSLTNHRHGISMIILERPNKNKSYYVVQVGYNNDLRLEIYYIFYVYKKNLIIKYYDTISGEIITLEEWRKRDKKK